MTTFSSWYMAESGGESFEPPEELFKKARDAFSKELFNQNVGLDLIFDTNHGNLDSVLKAVQDIRNHYETHRRDSKIKKILAGWSERIHYYSGIMDVLISHHPEYTALAWGAMKFLFVVATNHEKLIRKLAAGLSQIAGILPRAEIISRLYPVPNVKHIIVSMYVHILKFLMRALQWYQERSLKHTMHAITQPTELRFNDILDDINVLYRDMIDTAIVSSHAEQRDMHAIILEQSKEMRHLLAGVGQLSINLEKIQASIATSQAINATAMVQLRQQLSDVQLNQLLDHLASIPLPEPIESFKVSLFFSNRDRRRPSKGGPAFWLDHKIQKWNCSQNSSLVMVKGSRMLRAHIRNFCIQSIAALREVKIPVIWALKTMVVSGATSEEISTISLLKYLVSQAILVNKKIHDDMILSPRLGAYRAAETEKEWVNMLASVLEGIPLVYIIIDVEVLDRSQKGLPGFWPSALLDMLSDLSARNINTIVRVVLVSYGTSLLSTDRRYRDLTVSANGARQARLTARRSSSDVDQNSLKLGLLAVGKRRHFCLGQSTRRKRHN